MDDLPRTLFPLNTNKVLVERGAKEILDYAEALVDGQGSFLPQRRVYANKDALHLRRTVKLDAVAEFFLYDLIYRNRTRFRKPHTKKRRHFGYRFEDGKPMSPSRSYSEFKRAISSESLLAEFLCFDVSAYFNGVYHHDLHAWFAALEPENPKDSISFGKFFREINAGRSLDCLPQGIYPTKMIGNDFLRFIEESSMLRSDQIVRFMDDVYLFDEDDEVLQSDFAEVQRLLGLKGLSVNPSKTRTGGMPSTGEADEQLGQLKKRLLKRRRYLILSHYDDPLEDDEGDEDDEEGMAELDEEEIEFILSLLSAGNLSEEDAELILIVMRDHVDQIEEHLGLFARGFPHLAKNFYGLCTDAEDKEAVAEIVLEIANEGGYLSEYQLFWLGMMLDSYLMNTKKASAIINALYNHQCATDITRAKILEIQDLRYGLPEMRERFLREGRSDWLAWASAVGSVAMDNQARNYLLDYFKNGSSMNDLIASILQKD